MATKNQKLVKIAENFQLPLHFNIPVGMPSKYATNVLIQVGEDEVIISFFEAQPPIIMNDSPEVVEMLKKTGIRADCVAKVVVPKNKFINFSKAFSDIAGAIDDKDKKNK